MKKILVSVVALLTLVGLAQAKQATTQYERALINAAKEGNASQVRGLLEAGTDPNVTDEHGNTPLIYAAKENLASVDMLLFAGADVNARGENGITALINSFSIVTPEAKKIRERLLKAKPDVNAVMNLPRCKSEDRLWGSYLWGEDQFWHNKSKCDEPNPATALSFARDSNDASAVEMLLKNGADENFGRLEAWNKPDKAQQKLNDKLCAAAEQGNVKKVKKLLEQGANPNGRDSDGFLPLAKAISTKKANIDVVNALLEKGADPNFHNSKHYETILMVAIDRRASVEMIEALIKAGADVNARNRSYSTVLHYNFYKDSIEKLKLLIQSGADVNARNMYGRTPLFGASEEQVKLYISAGADVNVRDYEGLSALFHASVNPYMGPCVKLLQMHGAKLTPYEKRLLPIMQQRMQLNLEPSGAESTQQAAENKNSGGLGQILLQGLSNAAQDTANFAIQNAGKF